MQNTNNKMVDPMIKLLKPFYKESANNQHFYDRMSAADYHCALRDTVFYYAIYLSQYSLSLPDNINTSQYINKKNYYDIKNEHDDSIIKNQVNNKISIQDGDLLKQIRSMLLKYQNQVQNSNTLISKIPEKYPC